MTSTRSGDAAQAHLSFLTQRRSRRHYTAATVPFDRVCRVLEAACQAPSGANSQPWEFVLIPQGPHRSPIREMCEVADKRFHETAPEWLKDWLRHHDVSAEKLYFDDAPWLVAVFSRRNLPYWLPSVWLAIANLVNQVEAEGLHTVVYTPTLGRNFNELLGVDPEWSFQALLPLGIARADEVVKPRPRQPVAEKARVWDGTLRPLGDTPRVP